MNKKIAILLSGRIKGYKNVIENLLDIQKTYNPIFFLSLNCKEETQEIKEFCNIFKVGNLQLSLEETIYPKWLLDNIEKYTHCNPKNVYSMFYHNYSSFQLLEKYQIENNIKFDIIIKYRGDIETYDIIKLDDCINENNIYIPKCYNYKGVNDQIAYGDFSTMKKYCLLIKNLKIYLDQNILFNGETILKHHIKNERIILKRFIYNYNLNKYRF